MRKFGVIVLTAFAILLCSCGDGRSLGETYRLISNLYMTTNGGEFLISNDGKLKFYDFTSMVETYVCSKPNCQHNDESICSAYGMGYHPFFFGDSLYFFDTGFKNEDGRTVCYSELWKAKPDGSSRKKLVTVNARLETYYSAVLNGNMLYFVGAQPEFDEFGTTSGKGSQALYSLNLNTNKSEKLYDFCEGYHSYGSVNGIFGDKLYFWGSSSEVEIDFMAENYIDTTEAFYYVMNLESGEIKLSDMPAPMLICPDCYVSAEDGKTVIYKPDSAEPIILDSFIEDRYPDIRLVNNKLFSRFDGKVYDLETGKIYTLLTEPKVQIRDYINGSYIVCRFEVDKYIFGKALENDLIGEEIS